MEPKHWEVFTVAPVERVGDVEWTPVALDQMLNGGGAVREASLALVREIETPGGASGSPGGSPKAKVLNPKTSAKARDAKSKARGTEPSSAGARRRDRAVSFARGAATVYGCGALVCYSNRAPDDVRVDGASVRGWTWSKRDGCLTVPLGTREGTHDVAATFRAR